MEKKGFFNSCCSCVLFPEPRADRFAGAVCSYVEQKNHDEKRTPNYQVNEASTSTTSFVSKDISILRRITHHHRLQSLNHKSLKDTLQHG